MVDLTVVNPTKNTFPTGQQLNCPVTLGIIAPFNPAIGSGTLTSFWSNGAAGNGQYGTIAGSGTFNVSVKLSSDNVHWDVNITLTGAFAGNSLQFTADAAQSGNSVTFTNVANPQQTVTLWQDNGSFVTAGKIDLKLSTSPVTLYLFNAS